MASPQHTEIAPTDLAVVGDALLEDAAQAHAAARAARTIITRAGLRSTLIALGAGHELAEHDSPGSATLQVVRGTVALRSSSREWRLSAGELIAIPPERHSLLAETDCVVLLTVRLD